MLKIAFYIAALAVFIAGGPAMAQIKLRAEHGVGVQIGKNSFTHGSGVAVDLKGGTVNATGATATQLELGKLKFQDRNGLDAGLPISIFK